MAPLLKGTAYLTGAASGIGRATAFDFAKHGIKRLALTDVNRTLLLQTTHELQATYPDVEIEAMELDVCDSEAVDSTVAQAVQRFGRIDVGVNIAGISGNPGTRTADEGAEKNWMSVLDINLNGVFRCQSALIRAMLKQENLGVREGRGNIINVSSMFGVVGTPMEVAASPYTSSKHAIIGLTKGDATSYAAQMIRINAICPGYVETPLLAQAKEAGLMDGEIAKTPMKRMADVEEIADCIVFMASPMASFMTGSSVVVDGGYTCC